MHGLVPILVAVVATAAAAADVPVAANRLVVVDSARPRLSLVAKGEIPAPTPDGADDPRLIGAVLIVSGALGESAAAALPAEGWTFDGAAFRFRNPIAPSGTSPVRSVLIRPGRRVVVVARTPGLSLDEPAQQSVGVTLAMGTLRYCTLSGGIVRRDEPGRFVARKAPAPPACPAVVGTASTTSTSDTSTTATTSSTTTSTLVAGCPPPAVPGAFGLATARTIRVAGSPLLGGPTAFSTTLAGTFCIPSSGNPLVDNVENLSGPGAVSVPGTVAVCLGPLCL